MSICQSHWDKLREAIIKAGLGSFISENGEQAARNMQRSMSEGTNIDNYDSLMSAYFGILNNTSRIVEGIGGSPLYVMTDGPEDPIDIKVSPNMAKATEKVWPRCGICYLNLIHKYSCDGCDLPKENGFDWMIEAVTKEEVSRVVSFNK